MTNNQKFYGTLVAFLAATAFLVVSPIAEMVLFYMSMAWVIYSYRKLIAYRSVFVPTWLFYALLAGGATLALLYQFGTINFTAYIVYTLCLSSVLWALYKASGPEEEKKIDRYIPIDNRFS